jgi:hypothetical protein
MFLLWDPAAPVKPGPQPFSHVSVGGVFKELVRPVEGLLPNADFSQGLAGWAQVGGVTQTSLAIDPTGSRTGGPAVHSAAVVAAFLGLKSQTGVGTAVTVGHLYRMSAWVKPDVDMDFPMEIRWGVTGANSTGPAVHCPAGVWTQVSHDAVAPAGALHAAMFLKSVAQVAPGVGVRVCEASVIDLSQTPAYVNVAGAWKEAEQGWVRVGAEWK